VVSLSVVCLVSVARAQPSAEEVLANAGLTAADKQSVLSGQFVNVSVGAVSERDLSFTIVFLVKKAPEELAKKLIAGELITSDAQVKAYGKLSAAGSLEDFAKLTITSDEAKALSSAKAGERLNLSASEIAAFKALAGGTTQAIQQQLWRVLLARHQTYRASGLEGIAPYDRGDGRTRDPAADLRKASQAAQGLQKYLPAFHRVLLDYPQATLPEMQEGFYWLKSLIHGEVTYALARTSSWRPTARPAPSRGESTTSAPATTPSSPSGDSCPSRAAPWSSPRSTPSPTRSPGSAAP